MSLNLWLAATAFQQVVDNPALRDDLAACAYARGARYSPRRMALGYYSIYRDRISARLQR